MKTQTLLSRDDFRNGVFARDNYKCVICGKPAQDAHHILERRLWPDGGYYIDNGSSLCGECHILAEKTELSVERIREACDILKPIIPPHMYRDVQYDKWGNIFLVNGQRTPGELFNDESVRKILKDCLSDFTHYVKYPRSYHLPWSEGLTKDDRVGDESNLKFLEGEVVMTEKLDGENANLYRDYFHARSIDGNSHWTQGWCKGFHSQFAHEIPEGWRLCGENLFAKHSIKYSNLKSYFYLFSIWNEKNECLSWEETEEWAALLDLQVVPVIFKGYLNLPAEKDIKDHWKIYKQDVGRETEGYTVRNAAKFHYSQFRNNLGKFVRRDHVQTGSHWKFENIEQNELE